MGSLIDSLRRNSAAGAAAGTVPATAAPTVMGAGPTAAKRLSDMLAAGQNAPSLPSAPSGRVQESLQETAAGKAGDAAVRQVVNQATQIDAGNVQQAQQTAQQGALAQRGLDAQSTAMASAAATRAADLLAQYSSGQKQLSLAKDQLGVQELLANMRLSSDKYITSLQTEGAKARLDDAASFEEALLKTEFGDQLDLLKSRLQGENILAISAADFEKEMTAIDLATAIRLAKLGVKTAGVNSAAKGASTIVTGGAKGYEYWKPDPSTSTANDGPGVETVSPTVQPHGGPGWQSGT